jgi:hypothetical protein
MAALVDEFVKIEIAGDACQVGVDIIGVFDPADELHVFKADVGAHVEDPYPIDF